MSWTFDKIQLLLTNKDYEIRKLLKCKTEMYIDIFSKRTAESILLKVQSSLQVPSSIPLYYCASILSRSANEDLKDFTNVPESFIEKSYSEINPPFTMAPSDTTQLTHAYKQKVITEDLEGEERVIQNAIFGQLRRLKYCVKGMNQSLAMYRGGIFGILEDFDRIHLYSCNRMKKNSKDIHLYMVVELPVFVDKMEFIEQECSQVIQGIYSILISNQNIHSSHIRRLTERTKSIVEETSSVYLLQEKYSKYITEFKSLLDNINVYESQTLSDYERIKSQNVDSLQQDMKRTNQIRKLEKDLYDMSNTKKTLLDSLENLKRNKERIVLDTDSLLFDNIVWLNKLVENLDKLKQFSSEKLN